MTLMTKRGQSIGEYAILFAIVLGAIIAMQNYVRNRIAQRIQTQADAYSAVGVAIVSGSDSTSTSRSAMNAADAGVLGGTTSGTSRVQTLE